MIRLLVDRGVNVHAQGGRFGDALQAAAIGEEIGVIKLLMEKGVGVNVQGGKYGNTLQAAALTGKVDSIQLLIESGADMNALGGKYGTALGAAVAEGKEEATQILLDHGADVQIANVQRLRLLEGSLFRTALRSVQHAKRYGGRYRAFEQVISMLQQLGVQKEEEASEV